MYMRHIGGTTLLPLKTKLCKDCPTALHSIVLKNDAEI